MLFSVTNVRPSLFVAIRSPPLISFHNSLRLISSHLQASDMENRYVGGGGSTGRGRSGSSLDFSNSISLWRRMKPATAVFSGNRGKFDRVGALWFEVRGLRVRRRAASRNASPGGRAPSLGAAERHLVFARACGSGGVEGPPQIQISHFEFDLVRAA